MSNIDLTKNEAFKLIAPVIDGEVSGDKRQAFMDYIAHDEEVRQEYESSKKIKSLLSSRCPCAKAPSSLKDYVKTIAQQEASLKSVDIPVDNTPAGNHSDQTNGHFHKTHSNVTNRGWLYPLAAGFLVFAILWGVTSFFNVSPEIQPTYNVEEYAYQHFKNHNGQFVPPTISTASLSSAEIALAQNYDMSVTVPPLKQAEFKGVVYEEFVPGFQAPMLEYYLSSQDQYIYIFAFKLDRLKDFGQLARHQEAIKTCNKPKDFHIRNVNGKYVVSWKWNNTWYAAISNHEGNTLASMVEPLEYNPEEKE